MQYSRELDGLRAIAAILVLAFHAKVPGFGAGSMGVDVFFVLSGYLITKLLFEEHRRTGRIDYLNFFNRRLRRLYPPLLLLIIVYLACAPYVWPALSMEKHLQDALISSLYMADYTKTFGEPIAVINHAWSLGVEEKYYLLWPIILSAVMRLPRSTGILLIGALFVAATMWRIHNVSSLDNYWLVYNRFDTHCSGLLLGSMLGYANARIRAHWGIAGLLMLAVAMTVNGWKSYTTAMIGFTEVEIASAILVCSQPAYLGRGVLPWLGKMSYGFYLWHYFFIRVARTHEGMGWIEHLLIGSLLGMAGAVLSYYTVERYFRTKSPIRQAAT